MNKIKTTLAVAALAFLTQVAYADCCCPSCGEKTCRLETKTESVKKSCYKVECKEICIPKIKFCWPWQRGKAGCGDGNCTDAGCTGDCTAAASCTDPGCANGNCNSCSSGSTAARCGKVKTIKVLKKVDYECKKCGYEWKIYDVGCTSRDGCAVPANGPVKVEVGDEPKTAQPPQPPMTVRSNYRRPTNSRTVSFPR